MKKYGDKLFGHFGIMKDLDDYEILINIFGINQIKNALDNPELTSAQIADILLTPEKIEVFNNAKEKSYCLKTMSDNIIFNRATGLTLSSLTNGSVRPITFSRKCYGNNEKKNGFKTMIDILEENNVSKEILQELYSIYTNEIVSQYNSDMKLRNKTVLNCDKKYNQSFAVGGLQDHVTFYAEEDFKKFWINILKMKN